MCAGMLLGALGLCMIQIWPLWLKIGVWWCSVTFLTTFGILCIVRLVLFVLMWIVGFRGIWLFPNLFDDNQTFAGSFMPIFGKGDPVLVEEDSDEEYWEFQRKLKKKKGDSEKDKSEDEKVRAALPRAAATAATVAAAAAAAQQQQQQPQPPPQPSQPQQPPQRRRRACAFVTRAYARSYCHD